MCEWHVGSSFCMFQTNNLDYKFYTNESCYYTECLMREKLNKHQVSLFIRTLHNIIASLNTQNRHECYIPGQYWFLELKL